MKILILVFEIAPEYQLSTAYDLLNLLFLSVVDSVLQ